MISFEKAFEIVNSRTQKLPAEVLNIKNALGYSLAKPVIAFEDHPPFDLSAIDGYAVRSADVVNASPEKPVMLKPLGRIPASARSDITIEQGTSVLVMTGAVIPEGSDAVVPLEFLDCTKESILVTKSVESGENIRYVGSELKKGDGVLEPGHHITPGTVAMLATLGFSSVTVHRKPQVAVVTTGDELIDVSQPISDGRVRDSNVYFLTTALQKLGIEAQMIERVPDDRERLLYAVSRSIEATNVVIVTGGVAAAGYNVMGPIFTELGVEKHFWDVALHPHKPIFFGTKENKIVFGLPGNPALVGILFYELIYPCLLTLMGRRATMLQRVVAKLDTALQKRTGRLEFIRGYLFWTEGEWSVIPFLKQESHMLSTFANSNCIIVFPAEKERLEQSEMVEVHLLPWFYD